MQKIGWVLNLTLIFGVAFSASASNKSVSVPKLDQLQILYQRTPDQEGSPKAVIEWDVSKKICQAKNQDSSKASWIKIAPEKCRKIQTYLTQNWAEFEKRSQMGLNARGRANLQGPHVPLSEIEFLNVKLGVLSHQTETCDVTLTHCEPSSKDPADQLGYLVLSVLTGAFG
jgi:hypothetical protein